MKKLVYLFILFMGLGVVSCGNKKTTETTEVADTVVVDTVEVECTDTVVVSDSIWFILISNVVIQLSLSDHFFIKKFAYLVYFLYFCNKF